MVRGYTNLEDFSTSVHDLNFTVEEERERAQCRKLYRYGGILLAVGVIATFSVTTYGTQWKASRSHIDSKFYVEQDDEDFTDPFSSKGGARRFDAYSDDGKRFLFDLFQTKFDKAYLDDQAKEKAYQNFLGNLKVIDDLNKKSDTATYTINWFTDLSKEERKSYMKYRKNEEARVTGKATESTSLGLYGYVEWNDELCVSCQRFSALNNYVGEGSTSLPESFSWLDYNAVTEVQNQGACGDCWAFASADDMASTWYLADESHELLSLSAQELTSCDYFDYGCDGGIMYTAYQYSMLVGGLLSSEVYPFEDASGETLACELKSFYGAPTSKIDFWTYVTGGEEAMSKALILMGPMAVALNAESMLFYESGIDNPTVQECDPNDIDHAVLLVGYGVAEINDQELEYWLIKNSWGTSWGEDGYYRIIRGVNACGVAEYPITSGLLPLEGET